MPEIRTVVPDEVDAYLGALVRKGVFANKAELVRSALVTYMSATGTFFKGFDGENIFAPDGRLYQVEYAREAASSGGTAVGMTGTDGVLLAAEVLGESKLGVAGRKIFSVSDRLAMAMSGLAGDGWLVHQGLRAAAPKTADEAVEAVRGIVHRHTLDRGRRPLGVSLLLASTIDRRPRLFHIDPSGAALESLATAVGRGASAALSMLDTRFRRMRLVEAEKLLPDLLGRETKTHIVRLET